MRQVNLRFLFVISIIYFELSLAKVTASKENLKRAYEEYFERWVGNGSKMQNQSGKKIHLRRCHICNHVNESSEAVIDHCEKCHKGLQPMLFFNERKFMGGENLQSLRGQNGASPSAGKPEDSDQDERYRFTALPLKEYPPLFGLIAFWS